MTRRHGLERVIDFFLIARADAAVIHVPVETDARLSPRCDSGFANIVEVGTEAANEPFNEDLEHGSCD